ncbi:hypothetical protein J3Q64DRAFT_1722419 [Phycomyces blakesleeanus]|uniref:RBR-type E3 ubiquitin transferase n=1 Tax=Phycomyces blakesleeanus TaxID=4837 RepID=A0ABR3BAB1_PHYBL
MALSYTQDSEDQYTEDSDEFEEEEMNYWLQRCSICFDARLELCLELCRDQFCQECFGLYVTEVVKSSWGLGVTQIQCPVCQRTVPKSEWSKYVSPAVLEHYNKFNQPYRSYTRACPCCETENKPLDYTKRNKDVNHLYASYKLLKDSLGSCTQEGHTEHPSHEDIRHATWMIENPSWSQNNTLPEIYEHLLNAIKKFDLHHPHLPSVGTTIAEHLCQTNMSSDTWRTIQFTHIRNFPDITCSKCNTDFCLQCGEDKHASQSCEDNMRNKLEDSQLSVDLAKTIEWKLENSRRCPNCSIMIHRDEGCNKVDCSLCGFSFCWMCQLPWSPDCGFYRCSSSPDSQIMEKAGIAHTKAELGVPNVHALRQRR